MTNNDTFFLIDNDRESMLASNSSSNNFLAGMSLTTCICHGLLSGIGFILNGFIIYAIASIEELRTQTRYILFLGMLVGNILSFFNLTTEVIYYSLPSDGHNCEFLRALLGVPYIIFSTYYLLVLIDNYVAITRNDWHRAKCTVRNIVPCQIAITILFCLIAKFLYVVGIVPLDCNPSIPANMFMVTTFSLLIVPCVILKIAIYIKTEIDSSSSEPTVQEAVFLHSSEIRVHVTDETVAKREKEAVRALMFSVLAVLIIYIPRILFTVSTFVCSKLNPLEKDKCNFLNARPFINEFAALHGIIQPLIFLWFCEQFRTAWKNLSNH